MAAGDYLKVAAAQLQRASQVLQQRARSLLVERDRTTQQKANEITRHQTDLRLKQAELAGKEDNGEKAALAREVQQLQHAVNSKKQEVEHVTQQLSAAAQSKQRTADTLLSKARELESQASSSDLAE